MPFQSTYKCDQCGIDFATDTNDFVRKYKLPNGELSALLQSTAWCERCRAVVNAEAFDTVQIVANWENAVADPDSSHWQCDFGEAMRERFAKLVAWAKLRQSPPKCLRCGSSELVATCDEEVVHDGKFLHPRCGGRFRIVESMHFSPDHEKCFEYTVEGVPLNHKWVPGWQLLLSRFRDWRHRRFSKTPHSGTKKSTKL